MAFRGERPNVKEERNHWRDNALSQRHRRWGWNCPAIDLDFVLLEYDRGKAVAVVEYKHENAPLQFPTHPSFQALINLGDRADLPVFACRYADDFSWFAVTPLSSMAKLLLPKRARMTEPEWVSFLYKLRGYAPPAGMFEEFDVAI